MSWRDLTDDERRALPPGAEGWKYTPWTTLPAGIWVEELREHRRPPPNYHLTYSYMGPQDAERAVRYLAGGHSVAVVVPLEVKEALLAFPDQHRWPLIDGDVDDLRFLDPPGALVLLKPKGRVRTDLMRPRVLTELRAAIAS
jgi:hypothetical protein